MRKNRGDDTPRLVFCDWLEETFGPNPFATFIRQQIEYSRRHPNDLFSPITKFTVSAKVMSPRWHHQQKITSLYYRCWGQANWNIQSMLDTPIAMRWAFDRGFPSTVVCPFDWWERHARKICAIGPVGSLILTDYPNVYRDDHMDGTISYWFRSKEIIIDSNPNDATRHAAIENLLRMVWKPDEEVESLRIILP